ncbi:MAG: RNA polymerase sigma factor [Gammaproteobacteria bacterium]
MDNKQIEQAYIRYKDHIYNFIFRLANDHDIAMDVTQQTFLNALNHNKNSKLAKQWYISLARNIYYIETNRKQNISFDSIDQSKELNFVSEQCNQLPISMALKEIQNTIEKLIHSMPLATKEIIILYFIENLSIIEIANITKREIVDVKINLHHAGILFERDLISEMKGKVATSNDYCKSYFKITTHMKRTSISKTDQKNINYHISNCSFCIENNAHLKRLGILLNLTLQFVAPKSLDKIIYSTLCWQLNSKGDIHQQNDFKSARILPFINPIITGLIILISFNRFDTINTLF